MPIVLFFVALLYKRAKSPSLFPREHSRNSAHFGTHSFLIGPTTHAPPRGHYIRPCPSTSVLRGRLLDRAFRALNPQGGGSFE